MITQIFLAGFAIMLLSLLGVFFVAKRSEAFVKENLSYLISFSAGVFTFTTFFMVFEAYEIFGNALQVLLFVLAGYFLSHIMVFLMPRLHHHHNDDSCAGHSSNGRSVLVADGLHNIADGLILVPAFLTSPILGVGVAVSIMIHEALQEVSEFFVLRQSGFSTKKALVYNFLVSFGLIVGILLGLLISETEILQGMLLAISSGFFGYIIFHDLLPHRHVKSTETKTLLQHIVILILGVVLIGLVNFTLTEGHSHDAELSSTKENH